RSMSPSLLIWTSSEGCPRASSCSCTSVACHNASWLSRVPMRIFCSIIGGAAQVLHAGGAFPKPPDRLYAGRYIIVERFQVAAALGVVATYFGGEIIDHFLHPFFLSAFHGYG